MSGDEARAAILQAVRAARPPAVAMPAPCAVESARHPDAVTLLDAFVAAATAAGAAVLLGDRADVARLATGGSAKASRVLSTSPDVRSTIATADDPHDLDSLELFVCEGALAVSENGAVWVATSDTMPRAALFLATRVVIVVDATTIVPTLHDAYARIDVRAHHFGAFVAGPSKTADIEQALVIGAHGPKELTVIVVGADTPRDP
jgi:L-lactate dehydrogenase complex protein LldG